MMLRKMVFTIALVCVIQFVAVGDVIISDDFNRVDSTDLGSTAQGYAWLRYTPATLKPVISSDTLLFSGADNTIYLEGSEPKVKDFVANFQYDWGGSTGDPNRFFKFNFRNTINGAFLDLGGTQSGYELRVDAYSNTQLRVILYSEYGGTLATGYVDGSIAYVVGQHDITLNAVDNTFEVYVDDVSMGSTPVISFTDDSANPGKNAEGYFAMSMNAFRTCTIDNFVVTAVPEPTAMLLLGVGGIVGLASKKRK